MKTQCPWCEAESTPTFNPTALCVECYADYIGVGDWLTAGEQAG